LLHVSMIRCFAKHSRLIDLGVIPGELITLRRKLVNNAVVITVKGCDIALSPEVSANIMVERCETP
ncbi:MAG TPA: FeoA family protein, partial [Methanocorpusculum sp.]|nr:FeoA family protein [Methanocorpusculum sp.]